MRILITGASGLLGGRLANYLHQQKKYMLTMLSRNAEEHDCLKNYGSVITINWEDQNQLNNISLKKSGWRCRSEFLDPHERAKTKSDFVTDCREPVQPNLHTFFSKIIDAGRSRATQS